MTDHTLETNDLSMTAPQPPAGWYPDPSRNGRRYWDGSAWTAHAQALLLPVRLPVADKTPGKPKSAKLAFLLGMLLGPFGMLYTTLAGFAAMLILGVLGGLLFISTNFPFGFSETSFSLTHSIPVGVLVVVLAYLLGCAFWAAVSTPAPTAPPPPYDPQSS